MAAGDDRRSKGGPTPESWAGADPAAGTRRVSPSAARNLTPLIDVLRPRLPADGRVLEVASGTGQHVVAFARAFPGLRWTPSDPEPAARASIAGWIAEVPSPNVEAPLDLDVAAREWPARAPAPLDAMLAVNLLHISAWAATEGLMDGAAALLKPGAPLIVYGCFRRDGRHLSDSNAAFDDALRASDPRWGVRDVERVAEAAAARGLRHEEIIGMPANNLVLVFRRADQAPAPTSRG